VGRKPGNTVRIAVTLFLFLLMTLISIPLYFFSFNYVAPIVALSLLLLARFGKRLGLRSYVEVSACASLFVFSFWLIIGLLPWDLPSNSAIVRSPLVGVCQAVISILYLRRPLPSLVWTQICLCLLIPLNLIRQMWMWDVIFHTFFFFLMWDLETLSPTQMRGEIKEERLIQIFMISLPVLRLHRMFMIPYVFFGIAVRSYQFHRDMKLVLATPVAVMQPNEILANLAPAKGDVPDPLALKEEVKPEATIKEVPKGKIPRDKRKPPVVTEKKKFTLKVPVQPLPRSSFAFLDVVPAAGTQGLFHEATEKVVKYANSINLKHLYAKSPG